MFRHPCWVISRGLITYHKPKATGTHLKDSATVTRHIYGQGFTSWFIITRTLCVPFPLGLVVIIFLKKL